MGEGTWTGVLGLEVRGVGLRGGAWSKESSSWVMAGMELSVGFDAITARGYVTISSLVASTLGEGTSSWMGVKVVNSTLGCAAILAMALVSAALLRVLSSWLSTLGDAAGLMAVTCTSLLLLAARVKISSRRRRAERSSSHMLFGLYFRRASDIRLAAPHWPQN